MALPTSDVASNFTSAPGNDSLDTVGDGSRNRPILRRPARWVAGMRRTGGVCCQLCSTYDGPVSSYEIPRCEAMTSGSRPKSVDLSQQSSCAVRPFICILSRNADNCQNSPGAGSFIRTTYSDALLAMDQRQTYREVTKGVQVNCKKGNPDAPEARTCKACLYFVTSNAWQDRCWSASSTLTPRGVPLGYSLNAGWATQQAQIRRDQACKPTVTAAP